MLSLKQRLRAHHNGGIGGDKFCVLVFERYISREITSDDLQRMARKELFLRELNRNFIRRNLTYRFTILDSKEHLQDYEKFIKQGGIESVGKPFPKSDRLVEIGLGHTVPCVFAEVESLNGYTWSDS